MNTNIRNNLNSGETHGNVKSPGLTEQRCRLCNIPVMCKTNFIDHLTGKRHLKNRKFKKETPQSQEKILCVRGFPPGSFLEAFDCFWPYGLSDAAEVDGCIFIEFDTIEEAQRAAKVVHVINGQKLDISFKNANNNTVATEITKNKSKGDISLTKKDANQIHINSRLTEVMEKLVDEKGVDFAVQQLIDEIELKQQDYQDRYRVKLALEKFLQQMFPSAQTFIFGSSENSLGFTGCDIDMYADLGVNPWAYGTKQQMEQKAATLTNDIAREIRRKRRGYDVIPISKARVPIVKFKDYSTGIDVDLSFRSPMPIYNTSLIRLYTRTHRIVRPYLMLLRYWGKLQNVVGGGKPTTLLTNYCYTMMMLFWIMHRNTSIIPSVADLKYKLFFDNQLMFRPVVPVIVNGWDCSFSENVQEWTNRHHEISLISLAEEFFEFYGKFDASLWVISPLVGHLLSKRDLGSQDRYNLPPILHPYCNVAKFQSNTPFCVQDPFEHNHNIARGLNEYPLMAFQYKCRKAAEICKLIKQKNAPLSLLFKPIEVAATDLKHVIKCDRGNNNDVHKNNVPVEVSNDNDDENIAVLYESKNESEKLEESACCSSNRENQIVNDVVSNVQSTGHSISAGNSIINAAEPINDSFSDVEVIEETTKILKNVEVVTIDSASTDSFESESDKESSEFFANDKDDENLNTDYIVADCSANEKYPEVPAPLPRAKKVCNKGSVKSTTSLESEFLIHSVPAKLKCDFYFDERQEFCIDTDGNINFLPGKFMTSHLRENKLRELFKFVLGNCLMCDIEDCLEVSENKNSLKRKSMSMDDSKSSRRVSSKLFKSESGSASKVDCEYIHLFRIKCTHIQFPWMHRSMLRKSVVKVNKSVLYNEKALSDRLLTKLTKENARSPNILSYIDIWKKTKKKNSPRLYATIEGSTTIESHARNKPAYTFSFLKVFFKLFYRIVKDAFADIGLSHYTNVHPETFVLKGFCD